MTNALSAPTEVAIEVTKNCNLKCVQCFSWDSRFSKDEELSFNELKSLGSTLSEMKVFSVVFSGGEPFLRENFLELCDFYSKLNIDVGFSTNGTFLDDEACRKIVQFNLGRGLQISLDGSCKEVHDKIRGKGCFQKVIQGIRNLVKYGVNPSLATTVLSYNINDIENIINLARFEQCRHVHVIFLMPAGNALKRGYNNLNPNDGQIDNLMVLLEKLKNEFKTVVSIDWGNSSHTPPYPEFNTEGFSTIDKLFAGCPAGKTKILIDAFGNVYSCDILRTKGMCAGNIKNQAFEKIWAESNVLKTFRDRTPDKIKGKCSKCKYLNACVGGCPAYSVIDGYDIFFGDTSCKRNIIHEFEQV